MSRDPSVRVRFCPSPTGNPHVGLVRTCLFNWAFARHHGGTFVFRIEDTDAARDSEESYQQLLESLRWLGLDWDEGPEVGGPYGPYRQSERRDLYLDVVAKLTDAGYLYESFSTAEEIEARHRAAGRDPKLGYDNHDRNLTDAEKDAFRAEGRAPVLRFRMPADSIGWTDLVRGDVTFAPGTVPDYVVVRGNGDPLYPLVNPVDDALMRITHVLRGEDLLPSTPRQIALYRALVDVGVAERVPEFGHLPYVMGEGNKKLSKRDPQANLLHYRERGYLPEGLLNYLALLGWSIAEDRDIFTLREMTEAFDVRRVSPNPARFDGKKCEAINAAHLRLLAPDDFAGRLVPYLADAGLVAAEPTPAERELITAAAPLIQERMPVLGDAPGMLGFLFVKDITPDADVRAKVLGADATPVLDATITALSGVPEWTAPEIETALKSALVDGLGLKPRKAFAPVRAAITGRTVSPPLYESMELLGAERSLTRLRTARELTTAEG
ncbi:glutamate--tRNA ligase [Cryptosporangium aurantiacum]|uniref:Glutamate--tRNA ligase n=1 Tax=Cryptosporangium aurantiacum TaxID=134849 RepID=A0A1M7HP44_9ACTN|nr:glutamate--tRNA ligase [Cryptosporangium aurantiacum]SHM30322.1 glutamyl-tRNA synthetase [Cryptosporangium aurantiacum]